MAEILYHFPPPHLSHTQSSASTSPPQPQLRLALGGGFGPTPQDLRSLDSLIMRKCSYSSVNILLCRSSRRVLSFPPTSRIFPMALLNRPQAQPTAQPTSSEHENGSLTSMAVCLLHLASFKVLKVCYCHPCPWLPPTRRALAACLLHAQTGIISARCRS